MFWTENRGHNEADVFTNEISLFVTKKSLNFFIYMNNLTIFRECCRNNENWSSWIFSEGLALVWIVLLLAFFLLHLAIIDSMCFVKIRDAFKFIVNNVHKEFSISAEKFDIIRIYLLKLGNYILNFDVTPGNFHASLL